MATYKGNPAPLPKKLRTQAERVIAAFGGSISDLYNKLVAAGENVAFSTVSRWPKDDERGTGGIIPPKSMAKILRAAKFHRIKLTDEMLSPREG